MQQAIRAQLGRFSPVQLAFWGSLLLSLIAYMGVVTIGKDGAFYVDVAQTFLDDGISATFQRFNWPWFPMLLGVTHEVTGIPLETCAYLWCALLLAGTCALLVDCVSQRAPQACYWAVLVVLAMPSFNTFRADIIREYGLWFFAVLALWLAMRWHSRGGWCLAAGAQMAVAAAALFRLEALMLVAAFSLWIFPGLGKRSGWLRLFQLNWLPLLAGVAGLVALVSGQVFSQVRVEYYLTLLDPRQIGVAFHQLAGQFADTLKYKYSKDEAGQIIFFGILAAILIKLAALFGPFLLPYLTRRGRASVSDYRRKFALFAWGWLLYLAVLLLFFIHEQFINSRYVSFLALLAVPAVALAVTSSVGGSPRLGKVWVVLVLLVMLDNVVSLGAKKTHYIEAGRWLSEHYQKTAAVFYDDPRIGYYAGWGYPIGQQVSVLDLQPEQIRRYQIFIVEADSDEAWLNDWIVSNGLQRVVQFANRKGDAVHVIVHAQ